MLAAVAAWKYVPKVWAAHQARVAAEQQRLAAIASRADQQHAWVLASDPRRTYGADLLPAVTPSSGSTAAGTRSGITASEPLRNLNRAPRWPFSHRPTHGPGRFLAVEPRGFEPLTSALQRRIAVHVNGFQAGVEVQKDTTVVNKKVICNRGQIVVKMWPGRPGSVTIPGIGERLTVIVTQFVTADELPDEHGPVPLFIEDGVEAPEPGTGIRTSLARMVERISFESSQVEDDDGGMGRFGRKRWLISLTDSQSHIRSGQTPWSGIRRIIAGVDLEQDV